MSVYRNSMVPPSTIRRGTVVHNDIFPLLDFREIAGCLNECEFTSDEELLQRPTSQYINTLFEQIIESFVGISGERLRTSLRECTQYMENPDLQQPSVSTLAFQRLVHKFLLDCGIEDFNITDMIKPEPQRFRRILSAVVNFARFREEHMGDCEELVVQTEEKNGRLQELEQERQELQRQIAEMERNSRENVEQIKQVESHNSKVEGDLRQLKKVQEELTEEHNVYRRDKNQQVAKLQDTNYLVLETKKEMEKMRPYLVESPEMLHKINNEMNASLASSRRDLEALEKRSRLLDVSTESFKLITQDIGSCLKVVEDCETELRKEEEVAAKVTKYQEALEGKRQEEQELDRELQQLDRKIALNKDKIQRALATKGQKHDEFAQTLQRLQNELGTAIAERDMNTQDMDRKRHDIEATEFTMAQLKADWESEMKAIVAETGRLQAHIDTYLSYMERRI
ncbi:kinetochore protein Nuf2p [Trichomonascus vanleenenianus]|uniref:kinetochore-associated Ndc80 complex subunit NUF2 n=1 Tax=Trichomonascus vanleenenianus TaxID=2268995 RepID=UPI003ECAC571